MKMSVTGPVKCFGKNLHCGSIGHDLTRLGLALALVCAVGLPVHAQTNVTTQHNDISRTGANTNESILTPSNVNATSFGKLYSQSVDGYVYAQPLYLASVTLGPGTLQAGTTHNVVFVATEHDSVYAFDADSNGGANASPLWQITLLNSAHGATGTATSVPQPDVTTTDIVPEIGITSTGAIDLNTKTLYIVGKIKQTSGTVGSLTCSSGTPCYVQQLHALDVTTGAEKFGGPTRLSGSVAGNGNGSSNGTLNWDPLWENNRPSLLLLNGIVYIGFAAHGDNGPWHGWILAYNATTLAQTGVWCASPNGIGSGIWMSGSGLAADVPSGEPYGRMFVATGNGDYTATGAPYTNTTDYGDSIVRLSLTNGVPKVSDEFTPLNQANLNSADEDVASGGVLLLPDQSAGGHTHELLQLGKEGKIYVVDRETPMGSYSTSADNIVQEVSGQTGGVWGMPAYWNGNVYIWGQNNYLKAFSLVNGALSITPTSTSSIKANGGYSPTPSVSANGLTNGIVWTIASDVSPEILDAFDASNVANRLYSSGTNPSRDNPGGPVKFIVPTIANGKVYTGSQSQLSVFGLLSGSTQAATPVISPTSKSFSGSVQVTVTDSTAGASIYYTTNGATPTTASALYTGPITVSTTETIIAIASASGFLQSPAVSATYTLLTQTAAPTFSPVPSSYTAVQSVTILDGTPSSTIYYTTDGTAPSPNTGTTRVYSTPIAVNATTTIQAIATASGLSNSPVSSATYTITLAGSGANFSSGFAASASTMTFNGSTDLDDTRLQLTNGGTNEAGSAFYNIPVNIQKFTTDFTFQLSNAGGDGITFTIQGNGPTALGPSGGGLGYGPDTPGGTGGIPNSIAVKFDTYSNDGEGDDSTGLYVNGASPTVPMIDLTTTGIDLHSDDIMSVHLEYDGTVLSMLITDGVTNATFSTSWTVDIPGTVGGSAAYVGFTGGTGGQTSSQKIATWLFASNSGVPATAPLFSLADGSYVGTQIVTITDATAGSTIYYTTNGTTPATTVGGSTLAYAGPITVSVTETIQAIAVATGYTPSAVATGVYTISPPAAATPTFSPGGGTYSSVQTVTISDATSGAAIYYTTNGTTPATTAGGSTLAYAGPITVTVTETIQAIAVATGFSNSTVATAIYTISTPDFSLSPATLNLSVPFGGQGTSVITVVPQNGAFGSVVQLSCAVIGPAPIPTCALSPASVTPGSGSPTSMLTIKASASAMLAPAIQLHFSGMLYAAWLPISTLGMTLIVAAKRERRRWIPFGFLLSLLLFVAACAGNGSPNGGEQQGSANYTVNVTGTSGTIQHTVQLTVKVH